MTDKELLELAAKAAGFEMSATHKRPHRRCANGWMPWHPLEDDCDALRLAVRLRLFPVVDDWSDGPWVFVPSQPGNAEPFSTDPYAATRRAIVRAAAEIGRAM